MKVIIIGGGQVGAYIANLLLGNNHQVIVIENRESVFSKLKNDLPKESVFFGSGTDPNVLESCGIKDADVVASVSGADETNLVVSTIAKFEFNVPRVIARVNNPQNAWLFNISMGVDVGINQADIMAHIAVQEMDLKNILTLMKINHGNNSIIQIKVDDNSKAISKTVKELDLPEKALLIAVLRGDEVLVPRGNTIILSGDEILAFSDYDTQVVINNVFNS